MPGPLPPALVLAAGLGTRLWPLTDIRAKPALPVAGHPLVCRVLEWLAREGVSDVVVNLHHRPETITRVLGHGDRLGLRLRYSWEPVVLGSAGGPRLAAPLLGTRFFVINGDTLTDVSLGAVADRHRRSGAAVTLAVTPHPDPSRYGGVVVGPDDRVVAFTRAGEPTVWHFIGVQLVEADVFDELEPGRPAATVGGLYERVLAARPDAIRTALVRGAFHEIGTPADYVAACAAVAAREPRPAPSVGEHSTVDPTATLTRTEVWDRVAIGARCRLHESVITDDVHLPADTTLVRQLAVACDRVAARDDAPRAGNAALYPVDAAAPGRR